MNDGPVRPEADATRVSAALEVLRDLFPGVQPDLDPSAPGYADWLRSLEEPLERGRDALRTLKAWIEPLADRDPFAGRFAIAAAGADDVCGKLLAPFEGAGPDDTPESARDLRRMLAEMEKRLEYDRSDTRQTALRAVGVFRDAVSFLRDSETALGAVRELHSAREHSSRRTLADLRDMVSRIERLQERWYEQGRSSLDTVVRRVQQHPALAEVLSLLPEFADLPGDLAAAREHLGAGIDRARAEAVGVAERAEELIDGAQALERTRDYRALSLFLEPHEARPEMVAELEALRRDAQLRMHRDSLPLRLARAALIGVLIVGASSSVLTALQFARSRLEGARIVRETTDLLDRGMVLDAYRVALPFLGSRPPSGREADLAARIHRVALRKTEQIRGEQGILAAARWARTYAYAASHDPRRGEIVRQVQVAVVDASSDAVASSPETAAELLETAFAGDVGNPPEQESLRRMRERAAADLDALLREDRLADAVALVNRLLAAFPVRHAVAPLGELRAWCAANLPDAVARNRLGPAELMVESIFRPEGGFERRQAGIEDAWACLLEELQRQTADRGVVATMEFVRRLDAFRPGFFGQRARDVLVQETLAAIGRHVFDGEPILDDPTKLAALGGELGIASSRMHGILHEPLDAALNAALRDGDFEGACNLYARASPLLAGDSARRSLAAGIRSWAAEHPGEALETLARHPGRSAFYPAAEAAVGGRLALWLIGVPVVTAFDLPEEAAWIGFGGEDEFLVAALGDRVAVHALGTGGENYILETGESLAHAALGEFLVVASPLRWVLYRLRDGAKLWSFDVDISLPGQLRHMQLYDAAVSQRGRFLLARYSDLDGLVRVYDPVLRKEIVVMQDFQRPDMPVFSPDGGKLAVPRENEVTVALLGGWRDRLSLPLEGRPASVAFDPSGRRLAVAVPGAVEVYDVGNPFVPEAGSSTRLLFRAELDAIPGFESGGGIAQILFDPSGRVLLAVGSDGCLAIWDAFGWRLIRAHRPSILPVRKAAVAQQDAAVAYSSGTQLVVIQWRLPHE